MMFRKGQFVRTGDGQVLKCVCCDADVAIFAPISYEDDESLHADYEDLRAYSNDEVLGRGNDLTPIQESRVWEAKEELR